MKIHSYGQALELLREHLTIFLKNAVVVAGIFIISCVVYCGTFRYGLLQWDDQFHLTDNPFIQPDSPNRYAYFWQHPYGKLYIPITYNAWAWIYARCFSANGKFSPHGLRIANIAVHGVAAALVYLLLLQLLQADSPSSATRDGHIRLASMMGALFFALHPLQVESVAWISEFRGLLASVFAITAMLFYFRGGLSRYILPSVLLIAAFLCKPSVAGVPFVLFSIDIFWLRRPLRKVLASLALPIGLTLAALLLMRNLQISNPAESVPIAIRPFVAADALTFYLAKLAWPFSLAADYSRTPAIARASTWFWFAWLVPIMMVGFGVLCWRRGQQPLMLTACGIFIAGVLPVLGFVPFEFQHISTVADRYAYLALLGPALVVGWLAMRSRLAGIFFGLVIVLLGWRSIDQSRSWQNGDTLWQHAVAVNSHAVVATGNLAHELAERRDRAAADRLFHHVIELTPQRASGYRGLGRLAADANQSSIALDWYEQACAAEPNDAPSHDGAGSMLVALGRVEEAEQQFRHSVRLDPTFADGWNNLGALLLQRGRPAEARSAFENALTLNPRHPQAMINLAHADTAIGDDAAAERVLRHAAETLKQNPLPAKMLGQRALARRDWITAEQWFQTAVLIDPKDASAINDLGQALVGGGKIDDAIAAFERAILLRPDAEVLKDNLANARKLKRLSR